MVLSSKYQRAQVDRDLCWLWMKLLMVMELKLGEEWLIITMNCVPVEVFFIYLSFTPQDEDKFLLKVDIPYYLSHWGYL